MSSPWSAPDAGNARPGPVPPPPQEVTATTGASRTTGADNPFAPPSADMDLGPAAAGSVYGRHLPAGAYGAAPQWPAPPSTDSLAVASLVCGIAGFVVTLVLPLPLAPVALGLGIAALVRINRSAGARAGKGVAIAGIVLGGLGTLGMLLVAVLVGAVLWTGFGA